MKEETWSSSLKFVSAQARTRVLGMEYVEVEIVNGEDAITGGRWVLRELRYVGPYRSTPQKIVVVGEKQSDE